MITNTSTVKPNKRLFIIVFLLLISAALLGFATYAWLVLSTRPTVESVSLNVGANGGLEIALLSGTTYENTDLIQTAVGDSNTIRPLKEANGTWGNVIDLSDESYGLNKMKLTPSVLNVKKSEDGKYTVGRSILIAPTFGLDGRMTMLGAQSVSGVYTGDGFYSSANSEPHGVRAIGTANTASEQMKALTYARSAVVTDQTLSRQTATLALEENGSVLFNVYHRHANDASASYSDEDVEQLMNLAKGTENAALYVDDALRNTMVAFAASELSGAAQFSAVSEMLLNKNTPLADTLEMLPVNLPVSPVDEAREIQTAIDDARAAIAACKELSGGKYSWSQMQPVVDRLIHIEKVYYNGALYDSAVSLANGGEITVLPEGGVYGMIADYVGGYSAYVQGWEDTPSGTELTLSARSGRKTPRMQSFSSRISNLRPADGSVAVDAKLDDVIGYAVDLAFRTNAEKASLLLQTASTQRLSNAPNSYSAQGGGSYLETYSSQLSKEKIIELADAIRVSFIDGSGTLLAMAKLNTTNYETWNEGYRFPLYLYEYSIKLDNVITGERRVEQPEIIVLPRGIPAIVTAVVWLDGAYVNNSLSSYFSNSISSTLNLQFSTNAPLQPTDNESMKNSLESAATSSGNMISRVAQFSEIPGSADISAITVYSTATEAERSGELLPNEYYVIDRDGISYMRVYAPEDTTEFIVTGYDADMVVLPADASNLFAGMARMQTIRFAERFSAVGTHTMDELFSGCASLSQIDLSAWDMERVDGVTGMFADCPANAEIKVPARLAGMEAECGFSGSFSVD